MATDKIEGLRDLLTQAEAAHGVYETAELDGVYDAAWATWYAAFVVDHGIGDLVGRAISPDALGGFLASTFVEFQAMDPEPTEPWAAYTARRIDAEL